MDTMNGYSQEFESIFKILLASDIHLGAHEKDGVRGNDSFATFEEILKIGKDREVDFILLGGDLFDHNVPSPQCLQKCISLLRKYTMGDKPITVSFDSNPEENFKHCDHKIVNYLDPNLNISIPVYSIHGNHDDPSGFGRMSALDILSASGLVNYFGKWTDLTNVVLKPILMSKGSSRIALYGISNIRDERLHRLFASRSVQFEGVGNHANRFNILVLHQNRVERGPKNYIPEEAIPDFFDLVFWGHEHECRIDPEDNVSKGFCVIQPGSSVATSLSEGEAVPKHVAILKVQGNKYDVEKIKLKTVRPFVFETVTLSDWNMKIPTQKRTEAVVDYVDKYIRKKMLMKAKEQLTGDPNQPTLPLVRLRLIYTEDYQQFNVIRYSQSLTDFIANTTDAVKLIKDTSVRSKRKPDFVPSMEGVEEDIANEVSVEDITERILEESLGTKNSLSVLLARALTIGVKSFCEKDDKEALGDIVYARMTKVKEQLKNENINEDNIKEKITLLKESSVDRKEKIEDEARELLASDTRSDRAKPSTVRDTRADASGSDDDFGPPLAMAPTPARGKGSRGGRGSTARGTRARGRAAKNTSLSNTSMNITRFTRTRTDVSPPGVKAKKQKMLFDSDNSGSD